jgi:hypothetical protein
MATRRFTAYLGSAWLAMLVAGCGDQTVQDFLALQGVQVLDSVPVPAPGAEAILADIKRFTSDPADPLAAAGPNATIDDLAGLDGCWGVYEVEPLPFAFLGLSPVWFATYLHFDLANNRYTEESHANILGIANVNNSVGRVESAEGGLVRVRLESLVGGTSLAADGQPLVVQPDLSASDDPDANVIEFRVVLQGDRLAVWNPGANRPDIYHRAECVKE